MLSVSCGFNSAHHHIPIFFRELGSANHLLIRKACVVNRQSTRLGVFVAIELKLYSMFRHLRVALSPTNKGYEVIQLSDEGGWCKRQNYTTALTTYCLDGVGRRRLVIGFPSFRVAREV